MTVRAIRGAITVSDNEAGMISQATQQMLETVLQRNPDLRLDDLVSAIFTTTPDLDALFPAQAAREMGWSHVPMMCAQEIPVPAALPLCIRVLIHWNTQLLPAQVQHVYLREAVKLRPDLSP